MIDAVEYRAPSGRPVPYGAAALQGAKVVSGIVMRCGTFKGVALQGGRYLSVEVGQAAGTPSIVPAFTDISNDDVITCHDFSHHSERLAGLMDTMEMFSVERLSLYDRMSLLILSELKRVGEGNPLRAGNIWAVFGHLVFRHVHVTACDRRLYEHRSAFAMAWRAIVAACRD
ncbi:hypothetical protein JNJ66_06010 [Candidatus Saccharibacteria bacterium]|nr:hypothetical protein [Candidatus Saccharibacteria bacterium]